MPRSKIVDKVITKISASKETSLPKKDILTSNPEAIPSTISAGIDLLISFNEPFKKLCLNKTVA